MSNRKTDEKTMHQYLPEQQRFATKLSANGINMDDKLQAAYCYAGCQWANMKVLLGHLVCIKLNFT